MPPEPAGRSKDGQGDCALTAKVGIKNKRITAAWDEAYLTKVLFNSKL